MLNNGHLLQNRYLIESLIGAGGMGAVYLAIDQRFGTKVAVKKNSVSAAKLSTAFEREAQLLNGLRHPALPHVTDYFAEADAQYLVMQHIAGEDLSETLARQGAFPIAQVLQWADELLDALDYLHTQKLPVVHRDIKPQNLKLATSGKIILLDFGLAKGSSNECAESAVAKSVFGYSRRYAPLEQIQGTGTDVRSDLYSLAATLYHLLTGQPPVDALTRAKVVLSDEADLLSPVNVLNANVPVEIAQIVQQALALNANARPKTAAEMRAALKEAALSMRDAEKADYPPLSLEAAQSKLNLRFLNDQAIARTVTEHSKISEVTTKTSVAANNFISQTFGTENFGSPTNQTPPIDFKKPTRPFVANASKVAAATLVLCGGAFSLFNNNQPAPFQTAGMNIIQPQSVAALRAKGESETEPATIISSQNISSPQTNALSAEDSGKDEIQAKGSDKNQALENPGKNLAAASPSVAFNKIAKTLDSKEKPVPPVQTVVKPKTALVAASSAQPLKSPTELEVNKPETAPKSDKEPKSKGLKGFFGKIGSGVLSVPKSVFGKKKDKPD